MGVVDAQRQIADTPTGKTNIGRSVEYSQIVLYITLHLLRIDGDVTLESNRAKCDREHQYRNILTI